MTSLALRLARPRPVVAPAEWGIEPIPQEARTFSVLDNVALWGSLGFSLVLMVTGALLVPSLGLGQAILAVLVGAVIGSLLLALAALVGADTGAPSMVLYRVPLGVRGSYVASGLTVVRNIVWGTFQLALMAEAGAVISGKALGVEARPFWVLLFGGLMTFLALAGPGAVAWRRLRWLAVLFGFGLVVGALFSLTGFGQTGIPTMLERSSVGTWPSFWQAVDLIVALPVAFLPLAADYARFSRRPGGAFWGTLVGFLLATIWFTALGMLFMPAVGLEDLPGYFLGAGMGILGLVVVLGLELDQPFANVYSASVSLQNLSPELRQRQLSLGIGALCTVLALGISFVRFEGFLLLLGSIFVPLFGILAADYFLLRRRRLEMDALYDARGAYSYLWGVNPPALVVWVVGFLVYNWIDPGTLPWWKDAMEGLFAGALGLPFPLGEETTWLGASVPAFLAGFVLYALSAPLALTLTARARTRRRLEEVFLPLCQASEVPAGTMREVDLGRFSVAVANSGGTYFAFGARCPHLGAPLTQGTLQGTIVTCPRCQARFDIADGCWVRWAYRPLWLRMLYTFYPHALKRDIPSYDLRLDGDQLLVRTRLNTHRPGRAVGERETADVGGTAPAP